MNNTLIRNELIAKLIQFINPEDPKFSKEVIISGTSFEKQFPKQHNGKEVRIGHNYMISVKSSVPVDAEVDQFIDYWLAEDEMDFEGDVIYPDLKDYKTKIEDTKTFRYIIIMRIAYIRQRA